MQAHSKSWNFQKGGGGGVLHMPTFWTPRSDICFLLIIVNCIYALFVAKSTSMPKFIIYNISITRMHQFIATKVAFIASQPGQQFYRTDFPLEVIFVFLFFFIAFFFIGPFFFFFTGQEIYCSEEKCSPKYRILYIL